MVGAGAELSRVALLDAQSAAIGQGQERRRGMFE
jgi:hypothetical protein